MNLISLLLSVSFSELLSPNTFTEVPSVLPDKWRWKNDVFAAIKMSSPEAHNELIGSSTNAHLHHFLDFLFYRDGMQKQQLIRGIGYISVTRTSLVIFWWLVVNECPLWELYCLYLDVLSGSSGISAFSKAFNSWGAVCKFRGVTFFTFRTIVTVAQFSHI